MNVLYHDHGREKLHDWTIDLPWKAKDLCTKSIAMSIGISLHIGLNRVDPVAYDGHWDGRLNASVKNAWAMAKIGRYQNFSRIELLIDRQATIGNLTSAIQTAADRLHKGDLFLVTYAGHGGTMKDLNGDEPDLIDEAWCLYDGLFLDDLLFDLWLQFRKGVKILLISDSCFSGGMDRDQVSNQQQIAYLLRQKRIELATAKQKEMESQLKATVRLLSACEEDQFAIGGNENTKFTKHLLEVWGKGSFKGNHHTFWQKIADSKTFSDSPQHIVLGPENSGFSASRPFTIS
jgi:hypothetical protein